jgi:molecular chaperone DnaK (HSP70)
MSCRFRFAIGIDLGTSNSAIASVDTLKPDASSESLEILQEDSPKALASSEVLPSFLYFRTSDEQQSAATANVIAVASPDYAVGNYALRQTEYAPGRVVSSAKSWLCHGGVDREEKILPWGSEDISPEAKLSPVSVSAAYLKHFLQAWNREREAGHEDYRFEKQTIIITVPASFDEVAQRLTLKAAREAGYPETVRLLEEPQAALYAWMERHRSGGSTLHALAASKARALSLLVCDIGGGTSDFSLFEVTLPRFSVEELDIKRVAVSDHLLLGGDNIDLTLAHHLERKFFASSGSELTAREWRHLVFCVRALKERVLGEGNSLQAAEEFYISLPGRGGSLLASARTESLRKDEIEEIVLGGFFPSCAAEDQPRCGISGLREWGLPFAEDSAVSRHLAQFIAGRKIDAVLYNGGTLSSKLLRERLTELLTSWQHGERPLELDTEGLDVAVSRGAAYYGSVLEKAASRIKGGYARSLYLELFRESKRDAPKLLCILPQGFEEGQVFRIENRFELILGEPVRFQLYYSTHRGDDKSGSVVLYNDREFRALPQLQTIIDADAARKNITERVEVQLEIQLSEVGLLQVFCVESGENGEEHRFALEFNLRKTELARSEALEVLAPNVEEERLQAACEHIGLYYGKKRELEGKLSPKRLLQELESLLGIKREVWNTALLRRLWPALQAGITRRGRSAAHEATWLYFAGFLLRPGYGAELDEFRLDELWRIQELGLSFPRETNSLVQSWIMWRRVAGGLSAERQEVLFSQVRNRIEKKTADQPELVRLTAALERISVDEKIRLGASVLSQICGRKTRGIEHYVWALGRLGSRHLLNASVHYVVPPDVVESWAKLLLEIDWRQGDREKLASAVVQLARVTGDRNRDVSGGVRSLLARKLSELGSSVEQLRLLEEFVPLQPDDQVRLFGEELPAGLRFVS